MTAGDEASRPPPWPALDPSRLADAADRLAERLAEPDLRAQAFSLAAILRHLDRGADDARRRAEATAALATALAAADEPAVLAAALSLAAVGRAATLPVDWSRVTGG